MDEQEIFSGALDRDDPAEQLAFLEQACAGNQTLRARIAKLLEIHQGVGSFMAVPAAPALDYSPLVSKVLGDFRILREVGCGGMGIVYEAEQVSLGRRVALKVLPYAAMLDPRHLQRFHNEARAAASLEHPHIVPIHGVGCERGVHYYAMKFIDGQSLAQLIDDLRQPGPDQDKTPDREPPSTVDCAEAKAGPEMALPTAAAPATPPPGATVGSSSTPLREQAYFRKVAEWGIQAAEALEHAHSLGIVHRDIKPGNLLIDGPGQLWVTDFGLARMGTDPGLTYSGDVVGTLRYMSPEQALARHGLVDHHTDIYALGATLYELLTLEPAVDGQNRQEILHQIESEDAVAPRKRNRAIPVDLETIVLKALAKEPGQRYATAQALVEDLQRYLADQPIRARRPKLAYRAAKWAHQHRPVVWSAAAAVLIATAAFLASTLVVVGAYKSEKEQHGIADRQRFVAEEQERLAKEQEGLAREQKVLAEQREQAMRRLLYASQMNLAHQFGLEKHTEQALELLEGWWPLDDTEDLRSFDWYYVWHLCHGEAINLYHGANVQSVSFSPDGKLLVTAGSDGTVRVWEIATSKTLARLTSHSQTVTAVAFSPDGKLLVSGSRDASVRLWDPATWKEQAILADRTFEVQSLAFSPDGKRLAVGTGPWWGDRGSGDVEVWDVGNRKLTVRFPLPGAQAHRVAFSPDGKMLAAACESRVGPTKGVRVWDTTNWKVRTYLEGKQIHGIAFFPDGKTLAAQECGNFGTGILDLSTGQQRKWIPNTGAFDLACSPDGSLLAAGGGGPFVKLFDSSTGLGHTLQGHLRLIRCVKFSRDGKLLASGSNDGVIKLWNLAKPPQSDVLEASAHIWRSVFGSYPVTPLAMSPDSKTVATGCGKKEVALWDASNARQTASLAGHPTTVNALAFSPQGALLAVASGNSAVPGEITLWDLPTRVRRKPLSEAKGVFSSLAFSPDGSMLAASVGKHVKLWDLRTGNLLSTLSAHVGDIIAVAFSPDGTTIAAGTYESRNYVPGKIAGQQTDREEIEPGELKVWDIGSGTPRISTTLGARVCSVAYSPNGRLLAAGGWNEFQSFSGGRAKVWDLPSGKVVATLQGHKQGVMSAAFSYDGRLLATGGADGSIRLWDTVNWQERLAIKVDENPITNIAFSHDDKILATGSNGILRLYRTAITETLQAWLHWFQRAERSTIREKWQQAVREASKAIELNKDEAAAWHLRGLAQSRLEHWQNALSDYGEASRLDPRNASRNNAFAWLLVACPDRTRWNPPRAVELARKATELAPQESSYLNTLGIAQYRNGDHKTAMETLKKSMDLRSGGDAFDWFFLAMAHWQLKNQDEARRWYDKAVAWVDKNQPKDEELLRFRAEAAQLLGVAEQLPPPVEVKPR